MKIWFHEAASAEAEAAVRWYNDRVAGLGEDFRAELEDGVERIVVTPLAWPISEYDPRARRFVLWRFPFSVVYVVAGDRIMIAAVAHAKRMPGYWRQRVAT